MFFRLISCLLAALSFLACPPTSQAPFSPLNDKDAQNQLTDSKAPQNIQPPSTSSSASSSHFQGKVLVCAEKNNQTFRPELGRSLSIQGRGHFKDQAAKQVELIIADGSIAQAGTLAVTNAANARLQYGGGVAGAIHKAGGKEVQTAADKCLREHNNGQALQTGDAAITSSGRLKQNGTDYIINTVGPVCSSGENIGLVGRATVNALKAADSVEAFSITVPPISAGIFGCGHENVAPIIIKAVLEYLQTTPHTFIKQIVFIDYNNPVGINAFKNALKDLWTPAG